MDDILLFFIVTISLPVITMALSQTHLKNEMFLIISGTFIAAGGIMLGSLVDSRNIIEIVSLLIFFSMTVISLGLHVKRIFRGDHHA